MYSTPVNAGNLEFFHFSNPAKSNNMAMKQFSFFALLLPPLCVGGGGDVSPYYIRTYGDFSVVVSYLLMR
jgi:hypothetical protein